MGMLQNIKFFTHASHLHSWSGLHTQWNVEFDSHAVQTSAGVVFVDPIQPPPSVIEQLEQLGNPIAIILTNANHDRDTDWFRDRYRIQVYAHRNTPADCQTEIDLLVEDNEQLPGDITAIYLPGAAIGEIALYTKLDGGTILIGDVLLNPTGKGLELLADQYLQDHKLALNSLNRLLELDFQNATFAHGAALTGNAKEQIVTFLKKPKKIQT